MEDICNFLPSATTCNGVEYFHFVYEADIRPTVYEVLKFDAELKRSSDFDDSDKEGNFKLAGEPLYSYLDINSEFTARLNGMIEEIFSADRAFTQTCDADVCRYCNFSRLCQR